MYKQLFYLPYYQCEPFRFGHCRFLPLFDEGTKDLLTHPVHSRVEKALANEVDAHGKPLPATLIEYRGECFLNIPRRSSNRAAEEGDVRDTVELLCHLNTSYLSFFHQAAAENFVLFSRGIDPESDANSPLTLEVGAYFSLSTTYVGKSPPLIQRPIATPAPTRSCAPNPFREFPDLCDSLNTACLSHSRAPWFRRIVRACTIANRSILNGVNFDPFDRVLLLEVAFETLFDLRAHNGSRFAERLARVCGYPPDSSGRYEYLRKLGLRLHSIRSRYAHGNELEPSAIFDPELGELYTLGKFAFAVAVQGIVHEQGFGQSPAQFVYILETITRNFLSAREENHRPPGDAGLLGSNQ